MILFVTGVAVGLVALALLLAIPESPLLVSTPAVERPVGRDAVVETVEGTGAGTVRVAGERWRARFAFADPAVGQTVRVTGRSGLILECSLAVPPAGRPSVAEETAEPQRLPRWLLPLGLALLTTAACGTALSAVDSGPARFLAALGVPLFVAVATVALSWWTPGAEEEWPLVRLRRAVLATCCGFLAYAPFAFGGGATLGFFFAAVVLVVLDPRLRQFVVWS